MSDRIRVCFISHLAGKSGAEKALLELVDALRERDIECYMILPSDGQLINELKKREIYYDIISYKWWMGRELPLWKRISRTFLNIAMTIPVALRIKIWKCDIVYTNTIAVCVGAMAARLLRRPHVWHIHEFGYEDLRLSFDLGKRLSLWLIDKLSSVCITNSFAVMEKFQQHINPSKLKVIYQSVSIPQIASNEDVIMAPNTGIRSIIIGQLREGKRQEDAIRAIAELVKSKIKAELIIIGDGDPKYREHLDGLVVKNKLDSYIKFMGYVENPFPYIRSSDVLLMCSRSEAFGRVTVEAMKMGKPVIGTSSGGTKELIKNEFNGLLYRVGDYKELANKIRYLYKNRNKARQMGWNGQRWAMTQFTQENYGDEILAVLKQLIS